MSDQATEEKRSKLTIHQAALRALSVGRWIMVAYNVVVVLLVIFAATGVLAAAARSTLWTTVIAGLGAGVLILTGLVNLLLAILFRHAHPGWSDMGLIGRVLLTDIPFVGIHLYNRRRREWLDRMP